ncbi:hydrogenase nickel incorporation protein HypB [Erysipelotrichaceae bacterium Oil+RF-744-GAM-WT-6]|uniref:Hydrogenase nickel incorporation protein HypB n=1 Tax=Stecheria intestinalis TaxID=2606630 RepID=A0A7X2NR56_9FIRM|nr:hydrogenase nickel incorporation protein HypB [Stecheria intestinalis]MSS57898.1 hydrogenase nickel incorporation protein HypB [Stecheria intestinalis]
MKIIELKESVTASNDRDADALREELNGKGVLLINLMSSPGSGKTTLLKRTVADMKDQRIAVLEADIDSAVDAERMEAAGAKSIQVHTDGMCHMDAGMTKRGLDEMGLEDVDLAFLENVGNLICPAEFDTGAQKNVMILSVPEGDDKPLKYPLMFQKSDVLVVTKIDTMGFFTFSLEKCAERVKHLNPEIQIFPVSAKTGEGMKDWENWLREAEKEIRQEKENGK